MVKLGEVVLFYSVYSSALVTALVLTLSPILSIGLVIVDGSISAIVVNSRANITLTYVHSVERYRVKEEYILEGCGLRLTKLEWAGFGAGMPSTPADLGDGDLESSLTGGVTSKVDIELGEYVLIAVKHMSYPKLFVNGVEVGAVSNITLRTCLKVSLLDLVVKYVEFALLGKL
ncbi:MAG: DUF1850 domain-containing protein [Sulfolobales archaeon]